MSHTLDGLDLKLPQTGLLERNASAPFGVAKVTTFACGGTTNNSTQCGSQSGSACCFTQIQSCTSVTICPQ